MRTGDSVVVSTIVAVDPHTAFDIFTEEIEAWWKPKVRHLFQKDRRGVVKFEPGPCGRLVEVYDDGSESAFEVGRVRTWAPGERLVFEWRQAGFGVNEMTEVEVLFEAVEKGTRVTVEHRGWNLLALDHPSRHGYTGEAFTTMIGLRWAELFTALKAHSAHKHEAGIGHHET